MPKAEARQRAHGLYRRAGDSGRPRRLWLSGRHATTLDFDGAFAAVNKRTDREPTVGADFPLGPSVRVRPAFQEARRMSAL
jgi:hypothetical protein